MATVDFERWRGGVDEKLRGHAADIHDIRENTNLNSSRIGILEVAVGKLAVKIGVAAAVGSLLGGGLVSFIVLLATHTHGGGTP